MYQHLRDKDDEIDEDDDDDRSRDQTKRSNNKLQEMDGITGEHARVIEESDIITTFLNKNGKMRTEKETLYLYILPNSKSIVPFFSWCVILFEAGNIIQDYQNETHLSFDLSEVSTQETNLMLSDLHLFKRRMPEKSLGSNLCQITIYASIFING